MAKNIHERNSKRVIVGIGLFTILIIVGLLTFQKSELEYALNTGQMLEQLANQELYIYPYQLTSDIDTTKDLFIDIRDKFSFGKEHIEHAKNISAYELTKPENMALLDDFKASGAKVILYGAKGIDANGPCMFFRQLGYHNVYYLLGGFNYYHKNKDNLDNSNSETCYMPGNAILDYAKASKKAGVAPQQTKALKPVKVIKRAKSSVESGGC